MNRNITMLIVLALVVGTVLIAYNKWIMRDAYTISESASSEMAVNVGTQESQALQALVIEKDMSGALKSTPELNSNAPKTLAVQQGNSHVKAKKVPAVVQKNNAGSQLTLVTKTITVAEVRPAKVSGASVTSTTSGSSVTPSSSGVPRSSNSVEKSIAEKKVQLSPLASVSYAKEKLTVSADSKFTYKIFGLKEPDRFVVDVVGRFSEDLPEPIVVQDGLVKTVRLGRHEDRVRIVLDLKGKLPPNWSASQTNGTLSVVMK